MESPGAPVDVRERPSGAQARSSWPNSRASREDLAARGGRRSAVNGSQALADAPLPVPAQRSTTALATPPDGFAELAALLGVPGQRTAPPSWAGDWSDGMPAAHPSAPVPTPVARAASAAPTPSGALGTGWPTTDEIAAIEAPLRRRRRAASLPADGTTTALAAATTAFAPTAPVEARASAPSAPVAPSVPADPAAPLTRRARRAAQGPVDLQPRAAEPARPGSRRALREQAALAQQQPTRSDADVLAQLEALLSEPLTGRSTELHTASGPAPELDLRTDPLFPGVGWTRHHPGTEAPQHPLAAPAPRPAGPLDPVDPVDPVDVAELLPAPAAPEAPAPSAPRTAPWTPPVGITPVVLAPAPVAAAVAGALLAQDDEATTEAAAFAPRRGRGAHRLPRRVRVALPHVAVVSALGVATLVAPLVGTHLRAEADTATGTTVDAGASTARAAAAASLASATDLVAERASQALTLSRTSARQAAVEATAERAGAAKAAADQAALDQQAELQRQLAQQEAAAKAAADHQAALESLVGQCSGDRPDVSGTRNGRLTDGQMCDLWTGGHQLRSDAAVAFAELNLAYREHFGKDIVITDSYRSYAAQVQVRRKKPGLAAVPGTSEHGWGLAVDLGDGVQNSDEHYDWLIENAPKYGWDHPGWARRGGGGPYEPWHWEFVAGE